LEVSHNPLGSMTVQSAVVLPGPKAMTREEWVTQKTVIIRRSRKNGVLIEGQMGLDFSNWVPEKFRDQFCNSLEVVNKESEVDDKQYYQDPIRDLIESIFSSFGQFRTQG
jgi:hypothetical protein